MAEFTLTTTWRIAAPIERCWFCLLDREHWHQWWPYIDKVEILRLGNKNGIGDSCRYYWHTCLPYRLVVDIAVCQIEPFRLIAFTATGDLQGEGSCRLTPKGEITQLQFAWNVTPNKPWMKIITPIAAPIFVWNHQRVMKKGEQSFNRRLNSIQ